MTHNLSVRFPSVDIFKEYQNAAMAGITPNRRRALYDATAKALTSLHSTDVDAIGLEYYGQSSTLLLLVKENLKETLKCCNLLAGCDRVIGILDWELSTLGNQMCDVAYIYMGKPWPLVGWKFYIAFSFFRGPSILAGIMNSIPRKRIRWKEHDDQGFED
uniref:Uncharacterized protein n=1 Tax=Lactuca sativa TaxID=4236 RepID=A0A9R1VVP1_LACSA|nr:hypothetical protein LSAT_V11C400170870 [Lactuca sativa]